MSVICNGAMLVRVQWTLQNIANLRKWLHVSVRMDIAECDVDPEDII